MDLNVARKMECIKTLLPFSQSTTLNNSCILQCMAHGTWHGPRMHMVNLPPKYKSNTSISKGVMRVLRTTHKQQNILHCAKPDSKP